MSEYLVNGLRLTVLRQNLEHYQRGGYAPPDAISRMLLSCTDAAWGAIQEAIDLSLIHILKTRNWGVMRRDFRH